MSSNGTFVTPPVGRHVPSAFASPTLGPCPSGPAGHRPGIAPPPHPHPPGQWLVLRRNEGKKNKKIKSVTQTQFELFFFSPLVTLSSFFFFFLFPFFPSPSSLIFPLFLSSFSPLSTNSIPFHRFRFSRNRSSIYYSTRSSSRLQEPATLSLIFFRIFSPSSRGCFFSGFFFLS